MDDFIRLLYEKTGFDENEIEIFANGERYCGIMLKNGNIGVCATLGTPLPDLHLINRNLNDRNFRILLNAYFNAKLNYQHKNLPVGDILDFLELSQKQNIVMIGYFKPIVEKLNHLKINIFDLRDKSVSLPNEKQHEYLAASDIVIISATAVYNNTLSQILRSAKGDCYILGPSSVLSPDFFRFKNVKAIFGTIFKNGDTRVTDIINANLGTRHFSKFGQKVILTPDANN